ncbi:MAG: class I SAM-dependent methyltransferase [Planctomycetota bacterium]
MSKSKKRKKNGGSEVSKVSGGSGGTLAERADKYVCYQKSVQEPEHEIAFFDQAYRDAFGNKKALHLREDFCGTFAVCCEWVRSHPKRTALGVDLDPEPLAWGKEHNLAKLTDAQKKRVRLVEQDVRKRNRPPADILAAQNFSFWLFKSRDAVIEYFKVARSNLAAQGLMVMDMMGGGDCYTEGHKDTRTIVKGKKGFKYIWHQESYNPVTHDARFTISFKFKDGSRWDDAFAYDWRFWTLPEVREMLAEAGFSESHVYWEVLDDDGDETGDWERVEDADSDPSWVCYIVAVK